MRTLLFVCLCLTGPALSQNYPAYQNLTVNDYANILNDVDEASLSRNLTRLREETGVEMTVLTLETQSDYAPDMTLEAFATGLFDHWGIGDANRNDGVLVLIIRGDRVMRIELGAGYGRDWDHVAQDVVDDHFLPFFKEDRFVRGTLEGSSAVITQIVYPFRAGDRAPEKAPQNSDGALGVIGFLVISLLVLGRNFFWDLSMRVRNCPQCGKRGLRQSRQTIIHPTETMAGTGARRVHCVHCSYRTEVHYRIAQSTGRSGGSGGFGGGRSGGGGASGRF